jgi:hypothetical protein
MVNSLTVLRDQLRHSAYQLSAVTVALRCRCLPYTLKHAYGSALQYVVYAANVLHKLHNRC